MGSFSWAVCVSICGTLETSYGPEPEHSTSGTCVSAAPYLLALVSAPLPTSDTYVSAVVPPSGACVSAALPTSGTYISAAFHTSGTAAYQASGTCVSAAVPPSDTCFYSCPIFWYLWS